MARLVFEQADQDVSAALLRKARLALETAARAGTADAQWLLTQHIGSEKTCRRRSSRTVCLQRKGTDA